MIQINATPGPQLRAQLVGLGIVPSSLRTVTAIPPQLQAAIQEAAGGPSTGNGSGVVGATGDSSALNQAVSDAAKAAADAANRNQWLLWGGVGVGVLLLGLLIIRR